MLFRELNELNEVSVREPMQVSLEEIVWHGNPEDKQIKPVEHIGANQ